MRKLMDGNPCETFCSMLDNRSKHGYRSRRPGKWNGDNLCRNTSAGESDEPLAGLAGREWVNWNTFAWHPRKDGALTNRTSTPREFEAGMPALNRFLALYPGVPVVAVGEKVTKFRPGQRIDVADLPPEVR